MKTESFRLGLTGGIGSGKSTVASMLRDLGATLIDADAISRQSTGPYGFAIAAVIDRFGKEFIEDSGALDRSKMRELVFREPEAKHRLEALLHPLIRSEMQRQLQTAVQQEARCIVLDIPLLFESPEWRNSLHKVLVVDCTQDTQIQRVLQRSGLPRETINAVVAAQASRDERLRGADIVLFNENCTIAQLAVQVQQITPLVGL